MLRWLAAAVVLASMLVACADENLAPTPASTSVTATASVEAPPATSTPAPATPEPTFEGFRAGLWLIDVETGDVHVLYEGEDYPFVQAGGFVPGGERLQVRFGDQPLAELDLDGRMVAELEGITWRLASPDGRLVTWWDVVEDRRRTTIDGVELDAGIAWAEVAGNRAVLHTAGTRAETYTLDVLDLDGGQRETFAEDVEVVCCHGAPSAISPQGGFYLDTHVDATYLYDLDTFEVTNLGAPWSFGEAPSWAPDRDLLLVPDQSGEATILDPAMGDRLVLKGSTWPAHWSAGGAYVYWNEGNSTFIADASTGERIATWEGHPSAHFWDGRVPVADAEGGPAALLSTEGGTWVHHPALEAPRFIDGGAGGTWASSAERAAIAVRAPTGAFEEQRWDIVILDADGNSRTVAIGAQSSFLPPDMWWNEAGTHFLIRFPGGEWP